jgi:ABC-type sulfate/molybdate transport systems ATPase subunit
MMFPAASNNEPHWPKYCFSIQKSFLLDEPTKGIDNHFKNKLAQILRKCTERGATVIMVSHDIEFCGKYADRCAMFFDGAISTTNAPRKFFPETVFIPRHPTGCPVTCSYNAVTPKDVAELCIKNLDPEQGDPGPNIRQINIRASNQDANRSDHKDRI